MIGHVVRLAGNCITSTDAQGEENDRQADLREVERAVTEG